MTIGQILTAIALAASLVVWRGIVPAARNSPVAARLGRVYVLVSVLLALRLLLSVWPSPLLVSALMIAAAWLPLATLRLGEELVRRHAPRPVKLFTLAGAAGFTVVAVSLGLVWSGPAIVGLALFQAAVIAAVLVHLLGNGSTVSPAERQSADMIALALLLAVPLILTDFRLLFPGLPVRGGAFAALLLVLATSRLVSGCSNPARLLADAGIALAAGGVAALAGNALGLGDDALLMLAACVCAAGALVLLVERFAIGTSAEQGLVEALAASGGSGQTLLSAHSLLASGIVLEGAALADLPKSALTGLAGQRVIARHALANRAGWSEAAGELLDRHAASHLLRLSAQPPRFLAVMGGSLGDRRLDAELEIAALMLEREP